MVNRTRERSALIAWRHRAGLAFQNDISSHMAGYGARPAVRSLCACAPVPTDGQCHGRKQPYRHEIPRRRDCAHRDLRHDPGFKKQLVDPCRGCQCLLRLGKIGCAGAADASCPHRVGSCAYRRHGSDLRLAISSHECRRAGRATKGDWTAPARLNGQASLEACGDTALSPFRSIAADPGRGRCASAVDGT